MKLKLSHSFFLILLWFIHHSTTAQNVSAGGRFEVDYSSGCAPFTITITPISFLGSLRFYRYGRGDDSFGPETTYTFDTPGDYTIIEAIQNQIPREDSITIRVRASREPEFNVRNCAGNNVKVNVTDTYYDQFFIDFDDGTTLTINQGDDVPPHSYGTQGNYTITVRGLFNGAKDNCGSRSININTVVNLVPATINSLTVTAVDAGAGTIELLYNLPPNIVYDLEQAVNGAQNFQPVGALTDPAQITIENLNTTGNYYCYRINAFDVCSNMVVHSDTICSVNITATAQNNNNNLTWETSDIDFSNYVVVKDGTVISTINNVTQTAYNDGDVICNQDYCYRVINNYANGLISTSGEVCVTAFSTDTPAPVEDITSTIANEAVDINWAIPPAESPDIYFIYQSVNGAAPAIIDTVDGNNYTDSNVGFSGDTYCYSIAYQDACGNLSDIGPATCPVILTGVLEPDNEVSLNWTNFEGWMMGVNQYFVDIFDDQGTLLESVPAGGGLSLTDNAPEWDSQILFYQIRAVSNDPAPRESLSNLFRVQLEVLIFLPNAFTPNDDGLNDFFEAEGQFFQEFSMKIFNRWGEIIFVSDNKDVGWDGTFSGKLMPEGTYVYRVDVTDFTDLKTTRTGGVLLLRR